MGQKRRPLGTPQVAVRAHSLRLPLRHAPSRAVIARQTGLGRRELTANGLQKATFVVFASLSVIVRIRHRIILPDEAAEPAGPGSWIGERAPPDSKAPGEGPARRGALLGSPGAGHYTARENLLKHRQKG